MNRRHFLRSTGFSLGSLFIIRKGWSGVSSLATSDSIRYPDQIRVISDDDSWTLKSLDGMKWEGNGVAATLSDVRGAVAVDVTAPAHKLKTVILTWTQTSAPSLSYLGDHWERSYGDLRWARLDGQRIMPWYFMEYDGTVTNGFGVRTGCRALCHWQIGPETLSLTLDVRSGGNGVRLGDRTIRAAEIVVLHGTEADTPYSATRKFCTVMCTKPLLPKEPVYGINDWYFTYGLNSEEQVLEHAAMMTVLAEGNTNRPFCVIDAGWAVEALGIARNCWADDFCAPNKYFGDMEKLAGKIRNLGMRPGIWVRPLCGSLSDNPNILMPKIPRMDSPKAPFLDPTIPDNIERIKRYFILYRQWGYELIKHDFTTADLLGKWGFKMIESKDVTFSNWHFADDSRTNAEIILDLYEAIREASGDTCLIGCNTISHLSAGLFELQRIGDDTSGREWERTKKMGVNTLGFRLPHHGTFYSADGDCVGLTTKVPWEKNKQWMQLVAETGTPLFISAQKEAVGDAQREFIRRCYKIASRPVPAAEPLDWMENQFPSKWKLMQRVAEFDWT